MPSRAVQHFLDEEIVPPADLAGCSAGILGAMDAAPAPSAT